MTGWHDDGDSAECTTEKHSTKFLKFAECQDENTRQSFSSLPSVRTKTLGKVCKLCRVPRLKHSANKRATVRFYGHFAECPLEYTCQSQNTRQRRFPERQKMVSSPSVLPWHSATPLFAECYTRRSDQDPPPFFTNLSYITDPPQFTKNHDNSQ